MPTTFQFANNVNTTLAVAVTSTTQTTITLASSANLPTLSGGAVLALTLNDAATQSVFEVMYVTAISGAVCTVLRGQESTTAQTWLVGDYAYASVTAGILANFSAGTGTALNTSGTAQTKSGALTVGGLTSTAGVSVGGALTGATTGAFSGNVSMAGLTATTGTFSGAITGAGYSGGAISGTTGTFTGAISGASYSGGAIGGTTGTFTGAVTGASYSGGAISGTTGTFAGNFIVTPSSGPANIDLHAIGTLVGSFGAGTGNAYLTLANGASYFAVNAPVQSATSVGGTAACVPPVYTIAGAALANTTHIVQGTVNVSLPNGAYTASTTVTFTGAAVFANANFAVVASSETGSFGSTTTLGYLVVAAPSGNNSILINVGATYTNSSGSAVNIPVNFFCIGA
jgi:hypothetical protein